MQTYSVNAVDVKQLVAKPIQVRRLLRAGWPPIAVLTLALWRDVEQARRRLRRRLRVVG